MASDEVKRKVKVYELQKPEGSPPLTEYERVFIGTGLFHEWGVNCEESDFGYGNFSVAIVEMPDGTIKGPTVDMVEFVKD